MHPMRLRSLSDEIINLKGIGPLLRKLPRPYNKGHISARRKRHPSSPVSRRPIGSSGSMAADRHMKTVREKSGKMDQALQVGVVGLMFSTITVNYEYLLLHQYGSWWKGIIMTMDGFHGKMRNWRTGGLGKSMNQLPRLFVKGGGVTEMNRIRAPIRPDKRHDRARYREKMGSPSGLSFVARSVMDFPE